MSGRGERRRPTKKRKNETVDLVINSPEVGRIKAHVTIGYYPDGRVSEVFVNVAKVGADVRTTYEAWSMTASAAMQHGMPAAAVAKSVCDIKDQWGGVISSPPDLKGEPATSMWDALGQLLATQGRAA